MSIGDADGSPARPVPEAGRQVKKQPAKPEVPREVGAVQAAVTP